MAAIDFVIEQGHGGDASGLHVVSQVEADPALS